MIVVFFIYNISTDMSLYCIPNTRVDLRICLNKVKRVRAKLSGFVFYLTPFILSKSVLKEAETSFNTISNSLKGSF